MSKKLIYLVSYVLVLSLALNGTAKAELVGWWRLDDGSGAIATDSSASGNDGTFVGGPQWVSGQFGGALELDGDDWVDFGDILDLTEAVSIACWINPAQLGGGNGDHGWVARWDNYAFKSSWTYTRFTTPGVEDYTSTNTILHVGEWQHVAVTFIPWQAEGCVFYLNGIETERLNDRDFQTTTGFGPGGGPFVIGNNRWGEFYDGMIDDVMIYNRALTQEEVQDIMQFSTGGQLMLAETSLFIIDEVDSGNIAPELEGSLLVKIDAASEALARGNPNDAKVAMNDLKALINQVEAQTDKKITPEAASAIIKQANVIIVALGG